jgi:DNA mismatch repair protein MutL
MSDLIQLLPDSVANQIAAGEVVQRPASVLKELVENSIDAGSTKINVVVKDAGKTLLQVIDNGIGMSENDARMCFERHATSKIRKANDLFNILTMGFRGEAMASIAAIATVEMKTKKSDAELGTFIRISGSKFEIQEPVTCQNGTNISVKNLFFNVPARRKFLKSNSTELKHIMEEFQRIALGFPEIEMHLVHNDVEIYNLPSSKIHQRIINILGRQSEKNLIPIQSDTEIIKIKGSVGKPQNARKTPGEQFFFVNNRFMKHPYFYKAVVSAYDNIIQPGLYPSFFIYFDINPEAIDINIHPTKTEIKFENERDIWAILSATVKEGLGKHNVAPSIDFENNTDFEIPVFSKDTPVKPPEIKINPNYNPFETNSQSTKKSYSNNFEKKDVPANWNKLYAGLENSDFNSQSHFDTGVTPQTETAQQTIDITATGDATRFFQFKRKYILTSVKSGLMIIDQRRAHQRILFDEYIAKMNENTVGQKLLYPQKIELDPVSSELFKAIIPEIQKLGFEAEPFGNNTFVINSVPANFPDKEVSQWITMIVDSIKENEKDFAAAIHENIVQSLAKFLSIPYGKILTQEEMAHINDKLFISPMPNLTPDGKTIITIIETNEIEKKLN